MLSKLKDGLREVNHAVGGDLLAFETRMGMALYNVLSRGPKACTESKALTAPPCAG
jgi:hypothetical protein